MTRRIAWSLVATALFTVLAGTAPLIAGGPSQNTGRRCLFSATAPWQNIGPRCCRFSAMAPWLSTGFIHISYG